MRIYRMRFDVWLSFLLAFGVAYLVGLGVDKITEQTYEGYQWTTWLGNGLYNVYPIYDWKVSDIWKYSTTSGKNTVMLFRPYSATRNSAASHGFFGDQRSRSAASRSVPSRRNSAAQASISARGRYFVHFLGFKTGDQLLIRFYSHRS